MAFNFTDNETLNLKKMEEKERVLILLLSGFLRESKQYYTKDNVVDGISDYAEKIVKLFAIPDVSNRAGKFAVWLNVNRWFNYEKGKWHYTFEHGTAMSAQDYEKNYMKTHKELYAIFCKEHGY